VRLLLDTHAFLWWMEESPALSATARTIIADPGNSVLFSIASCWELLIRRSLGKLKFPADPETALRAEGFALLPVSFAHLRQLEELPLLHRDPFDRMLISQSLAERIPIVTGDPVFAAYPAEIVW